MSHDRGCWCGLDRGEYQDCKDAMCARRIDAITYRRGVANGVLPTNLSEITMAVTQEVARRELAQRGEATPKTYLDHLPNVANEDVEGLLRAEKSYGDSWKRRGGVGAFMMLARKWDRLEKALSTGLTVNRSRDGLDNVTAGAFDIFAHAEIDQRSEGVIDDIRDLRRYLMLVEAEVRARGSHLGGHRDNQPETK